MIINNIFTYFVIIIFSPLIGKLIKNIISYYKAYKKLNNKITLAESLHNLTEREFQIWCREYLSYLDFTNIILLPFASNTCEHMIGYKNSNKYYIYCKNSLEKSTLSINEIETFLGSMVKDNIHNGLIITTCSASNEIIDFIKSLKAPYNIEIISQNEISSFYSNYILKTN